MAGVLFMPSALPVIARTNRTSIVTLPYQYTLSNAPTNKPKPGSNECGEPLLETSGVSRIMKPIKPFIYHHFHDYLAGLLSRPDLEELMDKSCDNLMESMDKPAPSFVRDVFEAEFLRAFEGPKPGTLFVDRQGGGRYALV